MIPFKAYINNYKRFQHETVMLDKKLIAFVGPNEAGKSSIFEALLSIEKEDIAYEKRELHKGAEIYDDDVIVKVEYLINETEKDVLKNYNGTVRGGFFVLEKQKNGEIYTSFSSEIKRVKTIRKKIKKDLENLVSNNHLSRRLKKIEIDLEDFDEEIFYDVIDSVLKDDEWSSETLTGDFLVKFENLVWLFNEELNKFTKTQKNKILEFLDKFEGFKEIESQKHPKSRFLDYLNKNRPKFLFFSNIDRELKGVYQLNELTQKPQALINLLDLAEINIAEVSEVLKPNQTTPRVDLEDLANKKLRDKFNQSWSQAKVYPRLRFDVSTLNIVIESSKGVNELRDRSDGLRQYIAMKAFLEKNYNEIKPILLIDEAEIHLHYNAQADLVSDFEQQNIVNSILYTTHSVGCLPSDLGTGIRVVEPKFVDKEDTGISSIRNSIWRNNGGFSPLLLAMGANFIAFTPARKAVIAEGPSDLILLPRIFREALGLDFLEFQVAPGIAVITPSNVIDFELEASKVGYIVDGDEGGNKNKTKLIENGIKKEKIVQLSKNYETEDFIKTELLIEAIQGEFDTMGYEVPEFDIKGIKEYKKLNFLEKQCSANGIGLPPKVRIAESIVSKNPSTTKIINPKSKNIILKAYHEILEILNT